MGDDHGIYSWDNTLVMESLDGETFWVGCGWFFLGGRGVEEETSGHVQEGRFSLDDTCFQKLLVYVVLSY